MLSRGFYQAIMRRDDKVLLDRTVANSDSQELYYFLILFTTAILSYTASDRNLMT